MSNTRYTLFTNTLSKFLVDKLNATSIDHTIEMLRLEETFISGEKVTFVDVVPHCFRGNNFLFALHVPKSHIRQTSIYEIEEEFKSYFDPYIIPGYMWVKLADHPNTTYRFDPEREVESIISLESAYLLHIEVRYTNSKYIPDDINHGCDYPFPVVNPDRIFSMLKVNATIEEIPYDQDRVINTLKTELSAEKVKVSALQREIRIQEERNAAEKEYLRKELNDRENKIIHLDLHETILRRAVTDLQNDARMIARNRAETVKKQQAFIRKLYAETNREEDCPVCYETITSENLYVSDCCHVYCMSCAQGCYKANGKCAICRTNLGEHNKTILCPRSSSRPVSSSRLVLSMTQTEIMSVAQQLWSSIQSQHRELHARREATNNVINLVETDTFIPLPRTPDETPPGSPRTISAVV
jgi:hypothetical protein